MAWLFEKARPILQQVKRDVIQVLLDGIALSLTAGLAGRRQPSEEDHVLIHGPGPAPKPGEGHSPIDIPPKVEGPEAKGELPSGTSFEIVPMDDAAYVLAARHHPPIVIALIIHGINNAT